MAFEQHFTNNGSRGSLAEVFIDKKNGLIRKNYRPQGTTITGNVPYHTDIDEIEELFLTEIYWSNKFKQLSDNIVETYEWGKIDDGFYIIQEYSASDLLPLYINKTLHVEVPNIKNEIIGLFEMFKDHGVYKLNNALSNLTHKNGVLKAFDFKYISNRSEVLRHAEIRSVDDWLSKIDSTLKIDLLKYI